MSILGLRKAFCAHLQRDGCTATPSQIALGSIHESHANTNPRLSMRPSRYVREGINIKIFIDFICRVDGADAPLTQSKIAALNKFDLPPDHRILGVGTDASALTGGTHQRAKVRVQMSLDIIKWPIRTVFLVTAYLLMSQVRHCMSALIVLSPNPGH